MLLTFGERMIFWCKRRVTFAIAHFTLRYVIVLLRRKIGNVYLMKKWLIRIIVGLLLIFVVFISAVFLFDEIDKAVIERRVKNDNLKTVKADWQGVPVDEKGRFVNHEFPFLPKTIELLKWQLGAKPLKEAKQNDTARLEVKNPDEFLNGEKDGILWLGHASFFIRLNGKTIVLDPVFGKASLIKKYVEIPNPVEKMRKVDYVLVSHDHRDHCDEATLREIAQKFPTAKFLVGLEMGDLLNAWKTATNEVQTAGWFQQFQTTDDIKISFVPVRHWCRRKHRWKYNRLFFRLIVCSKHSIFWERRFLRAIN